MKHYGKHNRPDEGPKPKDYTPRERDAKNKAGWIDDRPDWITGHGMKDMRPAQPTHYKSR